MKSERKHRTSMGFHAKTNLGKRSTNIQASDSRLKKILRRETFSTSLCQILKNLRRVYVYYDVMIWARIGYNSTTDLQFCCCTMNYTTRRSFDSYMPFYRQYFILMEDNAHVSALSRSFLVIFCTPLDCDPTKKRQTLLAKKIDIGGRRHDDTDLVKAIKDTISTLTENF